METKKYVHKQIYSNDTSTYQIEILPEIIQSKIFTRWEHNPHFFIKLDNTEKRYRISASFKYLNENWGLKINIIRDMNKIPKSSLITKTADNLSFDSEIASDLGLELDRRTDIQDLVIERIFDANSETVVFIISRTYDSDRNTALVFFSKNFWNVEEFFNEKK